MSPKKIGQLLVENGHLSQTQLESALSRQTPTKRLGQVFQEMGMLNEQQILESLSKQYDIPCMKSEMFLIDPLVVELVPEQIARRNNVAPLFLVEEELTIAVNDPTNVIVFDELRKVTGLRINYVLATKAAIKNALDEYYSVAESIEDVIGSFEGDLPVIGQDEAPAVRLVNQILYQSMKLGASDIHIEQGKNICRVRFRIDGMLHEIFSPPAKMGVVIVSRLKIMAKLDISEKRLPQDGRFSIAIGDRKVDVRLSTLPTINGEKVVLRILDKSSLQVSLDHIGLDENEIKQVKSILGASYGLLLVTGPTGSGKTTSLYSMIRHLTSPTKNIVTVEDPVEYEFSNINQVQVNSKVDLTFSRALRSILRQDPDIILIGEIRDEETAAIAIRSALTGHFVLSTLHTNDAISSIGRLIDMSIAPYLLASSLVGVIAQRLVRTVCKDCVNYVDPDPKVLEDLGIEPSDEYRWAEPKGCNKCNFTGYKGRTAIFEILQINDNIRQMILDSKSSVAIREAAAQAGLSLLKSVGLKKVLQGVTTLEEVEQVTICEEA